MQTYIAFLRGINVSGQKLIKMETLRSILTELPIEKISTYIQSGNIIFTSNLTNISDLENQIANSIEKHFGYQVPVLILTLKELQKCAEQNPYSDHNINDPAQPYVTFLSKEPAITDLELFKSIDFREDKHITINKVMYIIYPNPTGNSKLTNSIIESKLKVKATTRNWKTINKLIELMLIL
ncbi:uncharacterized protein (DUF1697 family) [Flavobacterium sp. 90]|uniref:DUF1697 domain-containing protein n=1 Tax=unclassified Flavobacterium TaxID=196869 RepID=UPI000EABA437|nr:MULTISPECIES: DUF1697 domain-containing protein [unclassified Flavobacterium]RKR08324.1 uncharacterized protein (DUF1697 family) [Flavobacterium sp. 81]TCK57511.1 uncharacterized protein (DUF1697 family) [Flavobacterium sp. 90]